MVNGKLKLSKQEMDQLIIKKVPQPKMAQLFNEDIKVKVVKNGTIPGNLTYGLRKMVRHELYGPDSNYQQPAPKRATSDFMLRGGT